jgi:diaminohydroxyphosphoribosylaminopyrimidine deaminase/5-amino-6-(5-phosphoribosylamino)uracil reductase
MLWPALLKLASGQDIVHPVDSDGEQPVWELYAPIARGNGAAPFVVAQLGQSLDGRIATATGRSHYINGPESIRHLHRLRALVDAVIVGIGTVVADDPQLTVRTVEGRDPARVVIDPNGRLPPDARILAEDGCPVFAVQGCDRPRPSWVTPIVVPECDGHLEPAAIVAALAARGFRRILVEGGAGTVSSFIAAGAIDRLHLCIAPIVIGSGPIGISLPPIDELHHALRPQTSAHRLGRDMLFDCVLERRSVALAGDSLLLDGV